MEEELDRKTCSMCERVLTTSRNPLRSQFRITSRRGHVTYFASQCKECEQEERDLGPEPRVQNPRVDSTRFREWLLLYADYFVKTYGSVTGAGKGRVENQMKNAATWEDAAESLGLDPSQMKRILTDYTKVEIATIDRAITRSGWGTNLWELLPEQGHQSTPRDPSG